MTAQKPDPGHDRRLARGGLELATGFAQVARTLDVYRRQRRFDDPVTGRTVVLVHGWGATIGAFHTGRRHLVESGYESVYAHQYSAHAGDVDTLAAALGRRVDALVQGRGEPVHLVGWSLGGVVARTLDVRLGYGRAGALASVTTICSPHRGAVLAEQLSWLGPFAGAGRDLRPGSTLLSDLASRPSSGVSYLTIGGGHDRIVADRESRLDEVAHWTFTHSGHFSILERAPVWGVVVGHLRRVDRSSE